MKGFLFNRNLLGRMHNSYKGFFFNNKLFCFSEMINLENNFLVLPRDNILQMNNFNNLNNKEVSYISSKIDNDKVNSACNIINDSDIPDIKVELKNKTRKIAERKRKKRKTGKNIRLRWR